MTQLTIAALLLLCTLMQGCQQHVGITFDVDMNQVAVPPGIEAVQLLPAQESEVERKAWTVDEALRKLHRDILSSSSIKNNNELQPVSSGQKELAVKSYAAAKSVMTAKQPTDESLMQAYVLLDLAESHDPTSPEINLLMGDLAYRIGELESASHAFKKALRNGADDPAIYFVLGRHAYEKNEIMLAMHYFNHVRIHQESHDTFKKLSSFYLSQCLLELGVTRAGLEMLSRFLQGSYRWQFKDVYVAELLHLYGRRDEMIIQIADAYLRLNQEQNAFQLYAQLYQNRREHSYALVSRLLYLFLKQGREAQAGELIERFLNERERDGESMQLLVYAAPYLEHGEAMLKYYFQLTLAE